MSKGLGLRKNTTFILWAGIEIFSLMHSEVTSNDCGFDQLQWLGCFQPPTAQKARCHSFCIAETIFWPPKNMHHGGMCHTSFGGVKLATMTTGPFGDWISSMFNWVETSKLLGGNTIYMDSLFLLLVFPCYHRIRRYLQGNIIGIVFQPGSAWLNYKSLSFPSYIQTCRSLDSFWCSFRCWLPKLWHVGIHVDMGECVNASQAQSWECLGGRFSFQLESPLSWLDLCRMVKGQS